MIKNVMVLILLAWVSFSYARTEVAPETVNDSASYRVEKPVHDGEVKRGVAGGRLKKKQAPERVEAPTEESDSEVRYWQYQE